MAYEFVLAIIFGIMFLAIGFKLENRGIFGLIRLFLIIAGIVLILWGGGVLWATVFSTP